MPTNKFCKDCKWVTPNKQTKCTLLAYICGRPNPDLVTGEQKDSGDCWTQRRYYDPGLNDCVCGLEGKFYEEKPKNA